LKGAFRKLEKKFKNNQNFEIDANVNKLANYIMNNMVDSWRYIASLRLCFAVIYGGVHRPI
jgi:hypothetical protein